MTDEQIVALYWKRDERALRESETSRGAYCRALAERRRLAELGYTVAYEVYSGGEGGHQYFTLHATYDQLTRFPASGDYGYFLFLYGERAEIPSDSERPEPSSSGPAAIAETAATVAPPFPGETLTQEQVAERMYRANDAGDTGGPRIMNLRVDYGGAVVRVTAKGVSAEWLYGQLAALR